jgi:hypothetical protein
VLSPIRLRVAACVSVGAASLLVLRGPGNPAGHAPGADNCVTCHAGIEDIHPGYRLSCVDCHGGDSSATTKDKAHVLPRATPPNDERVLPETWDVAWQRFRNPSNLRVAEMACGPCHTEQVKDVKKSLHGTTSGHLGDGFYENGLERSRKPRFGVFPVRDEDGSVPKEALPAVDQIPPFRETGDKGRIETHYSDLARKACMQCHLHAEGRAVRGRLGMDGDYRGQGCAACHVTYADDGRSRSADPTIPKFEPGHPIQHRFTSKIPTETCVHCHYGDATVGLNFRGMAQLVPGQPAGPDVPGTTRALKNGVFYIEDPEMTPPDLHHAAGMHCIDCHTAKDAMGDGNLWPHMELAVEIECQSCHGDFDRYADLTTTRARRVSNLFREGERFVLVSKVTGKRHPVTQVRDLVDPASPRYNARAAAAMTHEHKGLECYACHSSWNPNFFGFHFDRNEQFTQLDLISGQRTPGRVSTQEKVFATFNQLRLGINTEGEVAPFLVGFSTTGSAHDEKGATVMRQGMPGTAAGLSGMTMVHHQLHTVGRQARGCVECHRTPTTYGMGSPNFRSVRELAYAVTGEALAVVALHGKSPEQSFPVAELELDGRPRTLALQLDKVTAGALFAFVACEDGKLRVVDLRNPVLPRKVGEAPGLVDPRAMKLIGTTLVVADGVGGLALFDVKKPDKPRLLAIVPSLEARAVDIQFPHAFVADGPGGLLVVDLADLEKPKVVAHVDVNGLSTASNEAFDVAVFFQYSRPPGGGSKQRSRARAFAFVAAGLDGLRVVEVTNPAQPRLMAYTRSQAMGRLERVDVRGVAVNTVFDLGSTGGGIKSQENDYVYALAEEGPADNRQQYVYTLNVRNPDQPQLPRGERARVYGAMGRLRVARFYNAPFLKHFVCAVGAGQSAGTLVDVSKALTQVPVQGGLGRLNGVRDLCFEEMAFDRMIDEDGAPLKDQSHGGKTRWFTRDEILRLLRVPLPEDADQPRYPVQDAAPPRPKRTER